MNETSPGDILNADLVTNIFGNWPSFHDAEILSIRMDRTTGQPSLEIEIHVFQMTGSIDEAGYYVLRDHTLATIRFDDIDGLEISDFNHQNVIDDIDIVRGDSRGHRFAVEWRGSNGCNARFACNNISVVEVKPFTVPTKKLFP
jgi:immunity protein 50 of polymorphic toxin system